MTDKITLPRKGERLNIVNEQTEQCLIVKRCSNSRDWFAHIEGEQQVRFGNAAEIHEDIDYFQMTSALPISRNIAH